MVQGTEQPQYNSTYPQSQFKNYSQELLLYFSQDFSAYFEWDIVLGTVEYQNE